MDVYYIFSSIIFCMFDILLKGKKTVNKGDEDMEAVSLLALESRRKDSSQKRKKGQTPNGAMSLEMLAG